MTKGGFLTTGQVAELLKVPRWKLAYWIERGDVAGPSVTVPGRRLFSKADIEKIRKQLPVVRAKERK